MKSILTLKSAFNLPKTSLTTPPSPYTIIKMGEHGHDTTGIVRGTCMPSWNYQMEVEMGEGEGGGDGDGGGGGGGKIEFYVYNSNSNYVDQLLGYGQVLFEDILTNTVTSSKVMLRDGQGTPLNSWLQLQHHNANPPTPPPITSQKSTIRLTLLSITSYSQAGVQWLQKFQQKVLRVRYGGQMREIGGEGVGEGAGAGAGVTLVYDGLQKEIGVGLELGKEILLGGSVFVDNIVGNCSVRVKMYYHIYQIVVLIGASIIQNGLLPQNHNSLIVQITNITIEPIKKPAKDWSITIYSVFGRQTVSKLNQPVNLYILNNTHLQFEYFDQNIVKNLNGNDLSDYEPFASYLVPVNSINWSNMLNSVENVKMYNSVRGIVVNIQLKYTVVKNAKDSGLIPKFEKPGMYKQLDNQKGILKVREIGMSGACFYQIFTEKTLLNFVYIPTNQSRKIVFSPFQIKNSTEYNLSCIHNIIDNKLGGTLYLTTYDHYFGTQKQKQDSFQNYIICKWKTDSLMKISEVQPIFHQRFLVFAKKITLVKTCKKFDSMIKDKLLRIKISVRKFAMFEPGLLKIQNCMVQGCKNSVQVQMIFDSNQLCLKGASETYMMTKPYTVFVRDNGIQIKVIDQQDKYQLYYDFEQLFGVIKPKTNYTLSLPLTQTKTLTLFYTYTYTYTHTHTLPLPLPLPLPQPEKTPDQPQRFSLQTPLTLKIKTAHVKSQGHRQFYLRVNKSGSTFETLQENPRNSFIRFRDVEEMCFGTEAVNNYIFFSLYCRNRQDALVIYSGYYPTRYVIGKGLYQIVLTQMSVQQPKNTAILIFQVLNNIPLTHPLLKVNLKSVKIPQQQYFRNAMKYYIVAEINNNPVTIMQVSKNDDALVSNNNYNYNEGIFPKNGESVVWRLYSSSKAISKQQFWSTQKELIASGKLLWSYMQENGILPLRFLASKDLVSKFSANKLAILQTTITILLQYSTEPQNPHPHPPTNPNPKSTDIQVFHSLAARINILQIIPYSHSSDEKTIEMKLMPFQFQFCAQSRFTLNKEFIVGMVGGQVCFGVVQSRKNKGKYYRKVRECKVNFKGKKIRTGQKAGFSVNLEGVCLIKADIVALTNKFTNNPHGNLKLLSFGTNSPKIKQVQIYGLKSSSYIKKQPQKTPPIKFTLQPNTPIKLQSNFNTNDISFCLYIILTFDDKQKAKTLVHIAQTYIDKLQNLPFRHEWIVFWKQEHLIFVQGEYSGMKKEEVVGQVAGYSVEGLSGISSVQIEYKTQEKIALLNDVYKTQNTRPDRKRGYKILITIPESLDTRQVSMVLQDGKIIKLNKNQHTPKVFVHKSDQQLKVKSILLDCDQIDKIQQLQQKNFTRRFLINRNPLLIVYLTEQPYAIAECKPQTHIINFKFHKIYSKQTDKKIAWVKSNKNDQILTRQFGLFVRHGNQKKFIRMIDQYGEFCTNEQIKAKNKIKYCQQVTFGYQPSSDQLQIFLYIHHCLNQEQQAKTIEEDLQNWTKLFPIAYGKICLQKTDKNTLVGCQLIKATNYNQTLDKALNNIFQIPNLNCLGSISIQKRKWGYITLYLEQLSNIQLQLPSQNSLIYLKVQVQSSLRTKVAEFTTEARSFYKVQKLRFVIRQLSFFYIQTKNQGQGVKITANLLTFNNSYVLFQKRIDISDYLHEPGTHPVTTQIKPGETKGLKNLVQIKFILENLNEKRKHKNIIQQARKINKVDIISFEGLKQSQMITKLLECQQKEHLLQVLNQIKQSVIYSKQNQKQLFKACGYYLQLQCDHKIISILLQMMRIQLCKYPAVIQSLTEKDITKFYQYMKIIFQSKSLQPQKSLKKLTTSDYSKFLQKLDLNDLDQSIKFQKKRIYNFEQAISSASLMHIQQIMPVIETFVQRSKLFNQLFKNHLKDWNQHIVYKQDKIFEAYLRLLQKIYQKQQMPEEILVEVLWKGLKKQIKVHYLINLWRKLKRQKMNTFLKQIFNITIKKFSKTKQSQQSVQSFKILLNYIYGQKLQIEKQDWKNCINRCLQLLSDRDSDFICVSMYADLILKLNSLSLIQQNHKVQIISEIKKILNTTNDKNIRIALNNMVDKMVGKKIANTQQPVANKKKFYGKYLIT